MANPILQLLEALRNMFTCDIGIDLGTANTLVYMKGRGIIIREPSVVAVDARTDELRVRCVGHEAKAHHRRSAQLNFGGTPAERRRDCRL